MGPIHRRHSQFTYMSQRPKKSVRLTERRRPAMDGTKIDLWDCDDGASTGGGP
jgi:hypothetical protein